MARIQEPPGHFNQLSLVIEERRPSELVRLAWKEAATHCRFRRDARYRFDAPDGSFGVMYAAFDLQTAFAEAVLRDRPRHASGPMIPLDFADIDARYLVNLKAGAEARPLKLIKLYDEGLAAAHTDNQLSSRDHYPVTRRWASAFHDHPVGADGIIYMSRYLGARKSVALFERCAEAIAVDQAQALLVHPGLPGVLDLFNVAIDPP